MLTISGILLTKFLGWKIKGTFPDVRKSIIVYAPHTSNMDALYGKLYLNNLRINHIILSKKELFFFPMNIAMKWFGSIPVRGVKNNNAIYSVAQMLEQSDEMHIIISPEGTRQKVVKWNKGFYYMTEKAQVPIIVISIDYNKKEIGIIGVIYNLESSKYVMQQINMMYQGVSAKFPENFHVELNN